MAESRNSGRAIPQAPRRFLGLAILCLPLCAHGEFTNQAIVRATAAIEAAAPRAQADPAHPIFHITAPAQWINDPNGPIYYRGYYHLFIAIKWDGAELSALDSKAPLAPAEGGRKLSLQIFIDRSVLEIFANQTVCITKVITPLDNAPTLSVSAQGGNARVKEIKAWPMNTIW